MFQTFKYIFSNIQINPNIQIIQTFKSIQTIGATYFPRSLMARSAYITYVYYIRALGISKMLFIFSLCFLEVKQVTHPPLYKEQRRRRSLMCAEFLSASVVCPRKMSSKSPILVAADEDVFQFFECEFAGIQWEYVFSPVVYARFFWREEVKMFFSVNGDFINVYCPDKRDFWLNLNFAEIKQSVEGQWLNEVAFGGGLPDLDYASFRVCFLRDRLNPPVVVLFICCMEMPEFSIHIEFREF